MFEKLLAPILSFMIITLLFIGLGIYNLNINRTIDFHKYSTIIQTEKTALAIDDTFDKIEMEFRSALSFINPESMGQPEAVAAAKQIFDRRLNDNIETVYIVKNNGTAYSNNGKSIDISDSIYYKDLFKEKKTAFSDIIQSSDTENRIIFCIVPKVINGKLEGGIGIAINAEAIHSVIDSVSSTSEVKFLLMNSCGKVIYHPDKRLINKILGQDIFDKNGRIFLLSLHC
jgi:hypothetical protein